MVCGTRGLRCGMLYCRGPKTLRNTPQHYTKNVYTLQHSTLIINTLQHFFGKVLFIYLVQIKTNKMVFLLITDTDRLLFGIFYSIFVLAIIVSCVLRNTPFGFLWHLFKYLCIGLLISFGIDFAKDKIKDWWSK